MEVSAPIIHRQTRSWAGGRVSPMTMLALGLAMLVIPSSLALKGDPAMGKSSSLRMLHFSLLRHLLSTLFSPFLPWTQTGWSGG